MICQKYYGIRIRIYQRSNTPRGRRKSGTENKNYLNQGELDEFEQATIEKAIEWSLKSTPNKEKILTVTFIKGVHKKMFSEVWGWAGEFRKTNKNIGVDKYQIEIELAKLMDDCKFWIENKSFSKDEIAIRFKHRIVKYILSQMGMDVTQGYV